MKSWKTWVLVAALGASTGLWAAEQKRGRAVSVEQRVARMKKGLSLSDEQAAKIETILRDAAAKREAAVKNGQADKPEGQALRQGVRRQIDEVLTPEQREKRDKIAAERKQHGGRGERR